MCTSQTKKTILRKKEKMDERIHKAYTHIHTTTSLHHKATIMDLFRAHTPIPVIFHGLFTIASGEISAKIFNG